MPGFVAVYQNCCAGSRGRGVRSDKPSGTDYVIVPNTRPVFHRYIRLTSTDNDVFFGDTVMVRAGVNYWVTF